MDKNEVLRKIERYIKLLNENILPKKVILYGSYAKGNWNDNSDIDIAVVVDIKNEDFLTLESLLYKLRRNIDVRIEPILLEEGEDKSGFLEDILKHGEILYSI